MTTFKYSFFAKTGGDWELPEDEEWVVTSTQFPFIKKSSNHLPIVINCRLSLVTLAETRD
jgi:hypothetical protein